MSASIADTHITNKGILVSLSPHSTKIQITSSRAAQIQWRVKNPFFPAPLSHSQSNVSIITSISPNRRWRRYMLVLLKILQRLSFFESFESAHSLHGFSSSIAKEELILGFR
ncbi:hypothetical protein MRB53_032290 [Persea americana]|uniref:Uncharacterized protein n=1 Tax=Persea americana TaxID=3435 RepID=A0ACC2KRG0_PERAE|nr:hypothetical protein MRB53_032290 [Persea americana]